MGNNRGMNRLTLILMTGVEMQIMIGEMIIVDIMSHGTQVIVIERDPKVQEDTTRLDTIDFDLLIKLGEMEMLYLKLISHIKVEA